MGKAGEEKGIDGGQEMGRRKEGGRKEIRKGEKEREGGMEGRRRTIFRSL